MPAASPTLQRTSILIVLLGLVPVALGTWVFGGPFLGQFFSGPFLWMSAALFGLAAFCVRRGFVPMRSGDRVYREQQPAAFRSNVRFMLFAAALLYAMNVLVAFVVLSRPR